MWQHFRHFKRAKTYELLKIYPRYWTGPFFWVLLVEPLLDLPNWCKFIKQRMQGNPQSKKPQYYERHYYYSVFGLIHDNSSGIILRHCISNLFLSSYLCWLESRVTLYCYRKYYTFCRVIFFTYVSYIKYNIEQTSLVSTNVGFASNAFINKVYMIVHLMQLCCLSQTVIIVEILLC